MAGRMGRHVATTVVVLLAAAAPAAAQGPPQATNYRIGADHRGYVDDPGLAGALEERWSRNLGRTSSYPVIAGGRVFVNVHSVATGWRLYALDRDTGETLWTQDVHGTPVYDGGRVFVMDGWGVVRAFAEEDGALEWSVALPGGDFAERGLVASGGRVYAGGHNGYPEPGLLVALDARTGHTLWSRQAYWGLRGRPAVAGGSVYASGGSCGLVYAFTLAGTFRWQSENECTGSTDTAPAVHAGRVYVPDDGYLHVFDEATGGRVDQLYEQRLAAAVAPAALVHVGTDGVISAQDPSTGGVLWTRRPAARIASSPIAVGDRAFVALADGTLLGLSLATGDEVWRGALRAPVPDEDAWNAPAVAGLAAGEGVLVAPAGGRLVAFAPPIGASVSGGPAGVTNAESVRFELAGSGLECRLDGPAAPGAWEPCEGEFARTGLDAGPYVFRARAGGPDTVRHFTVDRTPPAIEITYQPGWPGRVDMRSSEDVVFDCRLVSEGVWSRCPAAWDIGDEHEPGERFAVRATDAAGNVAEVEHGVDEDLKDPEIYLDEGPAGITSERDAAFRFSSSETVAWQCRLDGGEWSTCSSRPTFSDLADGPHELAVRGIDLAGRSSPVLTRAWTVAAPAQEEPPDDPSDPPSDGPGDPASGESGEPASEPQDAAPSGGGTGAPVAGATPAVQLAAPARVELPRRLSLRALARQGLRIRLECPVRCRVAIAVRSGRTRVGRLVATRAPGTRTLRVRLRRSALQAARLRVRWEVRAGERVVAGGRTVPVTRR